MVHYFLGTRLLASTNVLPKWTESQVELFSNAYFCPHCGDVWARVVVDGRQHNPLTVPCSKHGNGSFIFPWRQGCPSELPPEVLLYEFNLRLNNPNRSQP